LGQQSEYRVNNTSQSERNIHDPEGEASFRMNWLNKLRENNANKISSRLVALKERLTMRVAASGVKPILLSQRQNSNTTPLRERSNSNFSAALGLRLSETTSTEASINSSEKLVSQDSQTPTMNGRNLAKASFFKFGRKIMEAKETLKNGITKTVERRKKNGRTMLSKAAMACVSYQPEEHENGDSGESEDYENMSIRSEQEEHSIKTLHNNSIMSPMKPKEINVKSDPEQEAMSLAWQARAEAMSLAAEDGQQPSMQGFLRTPQRTSPKMWVVLRAGSLAIYTDPGDCQSGTPKLVYSLSDCVCRPLDLPNSFELGMQERGKTSRCWLSFWAESDVQCKAWVMAVQHSTNLTVTSI
jgi:hypothetical protein